MEAFNFFTLPGPAVGFLLGLVFALTSLTLQIVYWHKSRYNISSYLPLVLNFVALFALYLPVTYRSGSIATPFTKALGDAIAAFALQFDSDALKEAALGGLYTAAVGIASFAAFFTISIAIVRLAMRTFDANFRYNWRLLFHKDLTSYVIFTDLPVTEINDFAKTLEGKDRKHRSPVLIVQSTDSQYVQPGSELHNLLRNNFHCVIVADVSPHFLAHVIRGGDRPVRIYSLYEHDQDNQHFAETALQIFTMAKSDKNLCKTDPDYVKPSQIKRMGKIADHLRKSGRIYVSYQNAELEDRYSFERNSDGVIRLYNEYQWAAQNFVFNHPITDFVLKKKDDIVKNSRLLNDGLIPGDGKKDYGSLTLDDDAFQALIPPVHVTYLGFGEVNQTLFNYMAMEYQLPGDNGQVHYTALDKDEAKLDSFREAIEEASLKEDEENWVSHPHLIPFDLENPIKTPVPGKNLGRTLDLDDTYLLDCYLKQLIAALAPAQNGKKSKEILIVAVGSSSANLKLAFHCQEFFKRNLPFGLTFHNVEIYAYVKERSAFHFEHGFTYQLKEVKEKGQAAETEMILRGDVFEEDEKSLYADCLAPVVIFGRGARFAMDASYEKIRRLAVNASYQYSYSFKKDLDLSSAHPVSQAELNPEITKEDHFQRASSFAERMSNYALALSLPAKLAFFGLELKDETLAEAKVDTFGKAFVKDPFDFLPEGEKKPASKEASLLDRAMAEADRYAYSRISAPAKKIQEMEHNRWVVFELFNNFCLLSGEVFWKQEPKNASDIKVKYKDPSKRFTVCLTSNKGLRDLRRYFFQWRIKNKTVTDSTFTTFLFRDGVEISPLDAQLVEDVKLFHWNDVFLLAEIDLSLTDTSFALALKGTKDEAVYSEAKNAAEKDKTALELQAQKQAEKEREELAKSKQEATPNRNIEGPKEAK